MTLTQTPLVDWLAQQTWSPFAQDLVRHAARHGALTPNQAAAAQRMRDKVAAREARPVAPANPISEIGIYTCGDDVYKVVRSRQSGRLYAKRLVGTSWVYDGGAVHRLSADNLLTVDQAAEYGRRTGICVCCGAELDDRDGLGVRVGIGPVCVRRTYGLTQRQLLAQLIARGVLAE